MTDRIDINRCDDCKVERKKNERWFYLYPDIASAKLMPIAVYCVPCGTEHGLSHRKRT